MSKITLNVSAVVADLRQLADSLEALVVNAQEAKSLKVDETSKPKEVTLEDVRALLAAKKQEGKSITELLNKFGASKLTDIDPKSYADVLKAGSEL